MAQEGLHEPGSPSLSSSGRRANGLLAKSGGDTPKLSNGTAGSQRIAAKLSELVSRFQVCEPCRHLCASNAYLMRQPKKP